MCNAWNHPPGCRCGWGGDGSTGGGGWSNIGSGHINSPNSFGNKDSFADIFSDIFLKNAKNKFDPYISNSCHFDTVIQERENKPKTYKTNCWYCGDKVFYHTNGYGDCVLFDNLGYPWLVHECWTNYCENNKNLEKFCHPKIIELNTNLQKQLLVQGAIKYLQGKEGAANTQNLCETLGLKNINILKKEYGEFYRCIETYNNKSNPEVFNSLVSNNLDCKNKTKRIKCYYCEKEVFFHTNEFGDIIIFNELKGSWKIHECWEKYHELALKNTEQKELEIKIRPSKQIMLKRCEKTRKKVVLDGAINQLKSVCLPINLENLITILGMKDANEFQKEYNSLYIIEAIYKKKKKKD